MPKILGIEIGASRIRICEEDYKTKKPKVYKSVSIKTPAGVVSDGLLDVNEELVSAIKDALSENKIRTKQIIFSMNSTKIASREVVIPFVKENKVKDLIAANVSDYFPVDLDQYEIGHNIIGVKEEENGPKQYKVLVLAVPLTIIDSYFRLAEALGCKVIALDYNGNSIYQIIRRHCDTGVQMVVKVDENSTLVTILQDQEVLLQRTVSYGAEDAAFAIMDMEEYGKPDYEEAVRILREQNCLENESVAQSLSYLISGISRVVDYFSRNNGLPIENSYLSGFGGSFQGLADIVSRATELTIEPLREIKGLQIEKYFKNEDFGEFLTCIGAVIAPIGFMGTQSKDKKSMSVLPDQKSMMAVSILVAIAGFAAAAALGIVPYLALQEAKDEKAGLENRITELAEAETIYQEYLQERYNYEKLMYFQSNTVTYNEKLVAFIEEMEQKVPSSLNVQSFTASADGVSMSVTVSDKRDAAKLIQQFRTFDSVSAVEVASMTDTGAVMDGEVLEEEPMVSFTITVVYGGNEDATPQQAPDPSQGSSSNDSNDDDILE